MRWRSLARDEGIRLSGGTITCRCFAALEKRSKINSAPGPPREKPGEMERGIGLMHSQLAEASTIALKLSN